MSASLPDWIVGVDTANTGDLCGCSQSSSSRKVTGLNPGSSWLHVEVSLSKIVNRRLFLMSSWRMDGSLHQSMNVCG